MENQDLTKETNTITGQTVSTNKTDTEESEMFTRKLPHEQTDLSTKQENPIENKTEETIPHKIENVAAIITENHHQNSNTQQAVHADTPTKQQMLPKSHQNVEELLKVVEERKQQYLRAAQSSKNAGDKQNFYNTTFSHFPSTFIHIQFFIN